MKVISARYNIKRSVVDTETMEDNPDDKEHLGKAISLKIYDRDEIAAIY